MACERCAEELKHVPTCSYCGATAHAASPVPFGSLARAQAARLMGYAAPLPQADTRSKWTELAIAGLVLGALTFFGVRV